MSDKRPAGVPELKDGEALDRLTKAVEQWAKRYRHADDPERWDADFAERFGTEAKDLARRSTAKARRFTVRDGVLAVIVWGLLAGVVFVFSTFVMQLDAAWQAVFAGFAVLIAAVGIWQSYLEVTSAKRAADKLAKKEQWLLGVTRKSMHRVLAERAAGS